ncbi:WGR domain-containing protein [Litoribrevibacter euphylliae]|uniref:WGR domain-containing protein n=1 Tax=Litoribrevibacter euphylliae TaxID=1834034 RepID=A0ABV7HF07_9GAMM
MLIRWHKDNSYFIAHIQQDLFGGWVLTQSSGVIGNHNGKVQNIPVANHSDAVKKLDLLIKRNQKKGFIIVERSDEPTQLDWILEFS